MNSARIYSQNIYWKKNVNLKFQQPLSFIHICNHINVNDWWWPKGQNASYEYFFHFVIVFLSYQTPFCQTAMCNIAKQIMNHYQEGSFFFIVLSPASIADIVEPHTKTRRHYFQNHPCSNKVIMVYEINSHCDKRWSHNCILTLIIWGHPFIIF